MNETMDIKNKFGPNPPGRLLSITGAKSPKMHQKTPGSKKNRRHKKNRNAEGYRNNGNSWEVRQTWDPSLSNDTTCSRIFLGIGDCSRKLRFLTTFHLGSLPKSFDPDLPLTGPELRSEFGINKTPKIMESPASPP